MLSSGMHRVGGNWDDNCMAMHSWNLAITTENNLATDQCVYFRAPVRLHIMEDFAMDALVIPTSSLSIPR
jgi:hypothetical protein